MYNFNFPLVAPVRLWYGTVAALKQQVAAQQLDLQAKEAEAAAQATRRQLHPFSLPRIPPHPASQLRTVYGFRVFAWRHGRWGLPCVHFSSHSQFVLKTREIVFWKLCMCNFFLVYRQLHPQACFWIAAVFRRYNRDNWGVGFCPTQAANK